MIISRLRVLAALPVMAAAGAAGIASLLLHDVDDILTDVTHAIIGGEDV